MMPAPQCEDVCAPLAGVGDPRLAAQPALRALFLYRHGDNLQHGCRNWGHHFGVSLQPQDEEVPEQDRPGR